MKLKISKDQLTVFLGGSTLVLFSAKPYLLYLVEPAKSIGQVIGENAKDVIDVMNGDKSIETTSSKRNTWSNLITMLVFILFAVTIVLSIDTFHKSSTYMYGVGGGLLAIAGIGIYLSHLAIGLVGFIVIVILVVLIIAIGLG